MSNATTMKFALARRPAPPLGLTLLSSLALALTAAWSPCATADIRFEERGSRFSLDVRNEPIAKVMDSLAERFNFRVDGYPSHWSKEPMNFSATGDLERVLRSLLKDTSHVFEYRTDRETQVTRIASLKLLNEGVEGYVSTQEPSATDFELSEEPVPSDEPSWQEPEQNPESARFDSDEQTVENEYDESDSSANAVTATAPRTSSLSRSLEARARQSSAAASGNAAALNNGNRNSNGGSNNSVDPAMPNADMRALTQKALEDVKGLAEALRKAEGK